MNKPRINKLIKHLESIPAKAFNQRLWTAVIDGETLSRKHHKNNYECGMAACIGGHMTLVFPRLLRLDKGTVRTADSDFEEESAVAIVLDICQDCSFDLTSVFASHQTKRQAISALKRLRDGGWVDRGKRTGAKRDTRKCRFGNFDCEADPT